MVSARGHFSRRKYSVTVAMTSRREITIWATDEAEAMEKAEELVEGWDGVESAKALSANEGDDGW